MTELKYADLSSIIEMHKNKQITNMDIFEYYTDRIKKHEHKINALYGFKPEIIKKKIQQLETNKPDQIFLPIPIKELTEVKGEPTYYGSESFKNNKASYTRDAITELQKAGFYTFGRSKSCEFGMLPYTTSSLHGDTKNPWDLTRNPGGSSGGAAALVAAGLAPVAHATDGGGSIRIPASWCGLVGFKPSRGRVPFGPNLSYSFLSTAGVITRSVRDQKLFYEDVWTGKYNNQWIPPLSEGSRLREKDLINVGLLTNTPYSDVSHSLAKKKVREFANKVTNKDANIQFEDIHIDFEETKEYRDAFIKLWASMLNGIPPESSLEATTEYLYKSAHTINS